MRRTKKAVPVSCPGPLEVVSANYAGYFVFSHSEDTPADYEELPVKCRLLAGIDFGQREYEHPQRVGATFVSEYRVRFDAGHCPTVTDRYGNVVLDDDNPTPMSARVIPVEFEDGVWKAKAWPAPYLTPGMIDVLRASLWGVRHEIDLDQVYEED